MRNKFLGRILNPNTLMFEEIPWEMADDFFRKMEEGKFSVLSYIYAHSDLCDFKNEAKTTRRES